MVADPARLVALYRARESARPDAVFRDPLAACLAGDEGAAIAGSVPANRNAAWSAVARTHVIDQMVAGQVTKGTDVVVNLAAGLDTRPYRMRLPASLLWVEVDLADLLAYKVEKLRGERPACKLERVACDLSDRSSRRELLGKLNPRGRNVLVITEGLLTDFDQAEVTAFAEDLKWASHVQRWIVVLNPALAVFERCGWKTIESQSTFKTAAKLGRLPWHLKVFTRFANLRPSGRIPAAIGLLERI